MLPTFPGGAFNVVDDATVRLYNTRLESVERETMEVGFSLKIMPSFWQFKQCFMSEMLQPMLVEMLAHTSKHVEGFYSQTARQRMVRASAGISETVLLQTVKRR